MKLPIPTFFDIVRGYISRRREARLQRELEKARSDEACRQLQLRVLREALNAVRAALEQDLGFETTSYSTSAKDLSHVTSYVTFGTDVFILTVGPKGGYHLEKL